MSRLKSRFDALKTAGRKALIPFVTAGDPQPQITVPLMHELVKAGADVLELGIPFSDPMAEGPAIQRACERALMHHITLTNVLDMVRQFRETDSDTPVVLMGYLNPIEAMGYETFAEHAVAAGADGVITVDLPPEEADDYLAAFNRHGLDPVFLLAPTSTPERIRRVAEVAGGFVYYVSLKGVTGASNLDPVEVEAKLAEIRKQVSLPLGVGFGIKSPEIAAAVANVADAVVVGSALVNRIAELADTPEEILKTVPAFVASLRDAMDQVEVNA
ncbi:MAG: tryptophan synthase subunit alpha [Acidiferrobacterales bacterium]|jgi:tryptophan synthase alpha chain|nr:tryptophan synthase subunit alpha [Acidiferrobacterales bacterium]